jgi:hypothetical protein
MTAAACSRSDRTETGGATGQVTTTDEAGTSADTQTTAATPRPAVEATTPAAPTRTAARDTAVERKNEAVSGYQAMQEPAVRVDTASDDTSSPEMANAAADTAATQARGADTVNVAAETTDAAGGHLAEHAAEDRGDTVAVGDSAQIGKAGERIDSSVAMGQVGDTLTEQAESDRVRPPEDSSETLGAVTGDTRDTSTLVLRADTTAAQADTTAQAPVDTGAIQVRADTTAADQQTQAVSETPTDTMPADQQTEVAVEASPEADADTLATETERVRPPEDSTEVLGNVTGEQPEADAEPAEAQADTAPVAAAGVQPTGNVATGAEAIALMTREGQRCSIVGGDEAEDAQWDLASSPATMNPCGTGTMTLPRVQMDK